MTSTSAYDNTPKSSIEGMARLLVCLVLILLTLAVYYQTRLHEFVGFDDNSYIVENKYIQEGISAKSVHWAFSFSDKEKTYWHPITWLSHMLDIEMFGLDAGRHHLVNLWLHAANAIFLFFFLNLSTGSVWASAFAAAVFSVHPLNVESVAWAAERKNILSTTFWLLTMISYWYYSQRSTMPRYTLVFVMFLGGLLTKPMLVTLPFVFLLLDYWPLERFNLKTPILPELRRLLVEKIPFFFLSFITVYIVMLSAGKENEVISLARVPMALRLENAIVSYALYLKKIIWPFDLSFFYPQPMEIPNWHTAVSIVLIVGATLMALKLYENKYLITGWLWYLGTLVPVIGITRAGRWPALADRWTYVPSIGIFMMISWSMVRLSESRKVRKLLIGVCSIVIIFYYLIIAYQQTGYWLNSETLFNNALRVNPENAVVHYNLAHILMENGKKQLAGKHYLEALRVNPEDRDSHFGYAALLSTEGNIDQAIFHYKKAIEIYPLDSGAYNNIGILLMNRGDFDEAIRYYKESLRIKPKNALVKNNIGIAYVKSGYIVQALKSFKDAVNIEPENVTYRRHLKQTIDIYKKIEKDQ